MLRYRLRISRSGLFVFLEGVCIVMVRTPSFLFPDALDRVKEMGAVRRNNPAAEGCNPLRSPRSGE